MVGEPPVDRRTRRRKNHTSFFAAAPETVEVAIGADNGVATVSRRRGSGSNTSTANTTAMITTSAGPRAVFMAPAPRCDRRARTPLAGASGRAKRA